MNILGVVSRFWHVPVGLGLLATQPAATAGELNLDAVNRYARSGTGQSQEQVTSINQFSDVKPTDWAFQALSNLIERYGCVAGYPNGTYKGGQAMTRFEAAALLNACLDRITEVTDELKRLMAEFEKELAVLRGRVDGLEAKVGELEATQFSTTTKLSGQATFVIGANAFSGSDTPNVDAARAAVGATTFSYDIQLTFDTSFTGKDLLRTNLRAGNFADSAFGGAGPTGGLSTLEAAFQEDCGGPADCGDVVAIDKLFYQFPIGSQFTATVGGRVGQEDMLALWPSAYPSDTILNLFTLNGAPAAYNKNLGPGAGLWWQQGGFSISANYVAANGDVGDPNSGGIGTVASAGTGTVQIGYAKEQWGLAAIYSRIQSGVGVPGTTPFTGLTYEANPNSRTDAFGVSGYWQPAESGWIPSISAGWGLNGTSYDTAQAPGALRTSQSWMVGLQWDDAFIKGNALGMAVGQPVFATALDDGQTPQDGNFAWEWWYKWQVTDNISVTPALFYLSRPLGQDTTPGTTFRQLGGLVKTTFRF
ncbi:MULTISPECIES: iron uptake porin [unclassified Cyanobium]|uniref:iron uptake porin n=1 Tax=unclassified Cyanobium TaxID=2627006 RepID=UPI0020CC2B4D|nr:MULTISPECIES: iron uptake porin [unclassified Cyanobium]MCP9834692.1 carbohydrate porin [Cyanobium sp. La Preciosa 7G6]MCP9937447.1 carbohydrate porin [Cyanobium sp. Aljojuca 7A6]